ncbi:MAG: DUF411 domain-containing protein [Acidimicrobiia bacterium]
MKRTVILLTLGLAVTACAPDETPVAAPSIDPVALVDVSLDLYHSPGCSCCLGWVAYIESLGAEATITEVADLAGFKTDQAVPMNATSCHTAIVDGYVIEGHVPASAIEALLAAQPDIVGIALPGMPADSPGMGGDASTWNAQPVVAIEHDGTLAAFDY